MSKLKRKIIQLSEMQMKQLKAVASITGFSDAEIIRRAFDEYIEKRYMSLLTNDYLAGLTDKS